MIARVLRRLTLVWRENDRGRFREAVVHPCVQLAMTMDRRQDQRIDVELAVELRLGDRSIMARAEDVSIGGMCVLIDDDGVSVPVGERLEASFRLPDLPDALTVAVEVRWVDRVNPRRFGVRFAQGLRASQVWAIERLRRAS